MPTNHLGRILVSLTILAIALVAIFPLAIADPGKFFDRSIPFSSKHNFKPGIDMVGGTSLLYEIKPPEGGAVSAELSTQVMDALKKRVDPEGVRNLVWRPQGATRLEIQMPLTGKGDEAKLAREAFAEAERALEATNVRAGVVMDTVQRLSGEARQARLEQLAMGSTTRQRVFTELSAAWDARTAAAAARNPAAQGAAEAKIDELRPQVEPTNVNITELEQTLNVIEEATARKLQNPKLAGPSPDAIALIDRAKATGADFPARAAAIEKFLTTHAAFYKIKDQLDDAADLKRLLQGSGVLEYYVLVEQTDPRVGEMLARLEGGQGTSPRGGDTTKWAAIDKPEDFRTEGVIRAYAGRTWVLLDTRPEKSLTQRAEARWALKGAFPQTDPQSGETQVAFQLDAQGGVYMGRLTGANVGRPMAIVLDDKVISAPNIRSQINESGVITGRYTRAEINYLVNTLSAGSLPARLAEEPISERTVGPQLGADNLRDGFLACGFGLIAVAVFLIGYYYLTGIVAYVAVLMNLVLILGMLAALNATFTLPSVAALILTLGSAVDANVLIFERLREEQQRGFPIRTALRNAYDRAFSAILDSNVVTGITSLVLYVLGSEEVKGFGLTLLLGIFTSLFTSLYVTKTLYAILIDKFGVTRLGSVPLTFPAWDRALKPNIDWMGKVWILGLSSATIMVVGLVVFVKYIGEGRMFDIEFSSGTAVTMDFKTPLSQDRVRQMLVDAQGNPVIVAGGTGAGGLSGGATTAPAAERRMTVAEALPAALPVSIGKGDLSYEVVTTNADAPVVRAAVLEVFGQYLKIDVPSTFVGVGTPLSQAMNNVVLPVDGRAPTGRFVPEQWTQYNGGVAIFLEKIDPPVAPAEIQRRLTAQRLQPGQSRTLPPLAVYAPVAANVPTSEAVVLAVEENIQYVLDPTRWTQDVADPVWKLVNEAINRPPTLSKVSSFNPQVAGSTQQDAIIAIILALLVIVGYVWFRFGNLRYGTATVVALLHDTFFVLAALGVAHLLTDTAIGNLLRLEPFRINLTIVAGVLTVMGYSMADTIVVFDRIREIRGQRGILSRQVINDAINLTLSRTLLTASTTMATLFVMYLFGGPGIHGFTFVLLVGIVVGTYSSIAIAAPLLLIGLKSQPQGGASQPASNPSGNQLQKA